MKKLKIDYSALSEAFSMDPMMEMSSSLDKETGEVIVLQECYRGDVEDFHASLSEDADDDATEKWIAESDCQDWEKDQMRVAERIFQDPVRYQGIHPRDSHESWRFMSDFISRVDNERLQHRLTDAIQGRGAFRNFRRELEDHPREQVRWRAFEQRCEIEDMEAWLEGLEIEPEWSHLPKPDLESVEILDEDAEDESEKTDLDGEKIQEVTLALLLLNTWSEHGETRAWKTHSWDVMNRLHERGWISNPKGKVKSVIMTDEGMRLAEEMLEKHFGR